MLLRKIHSRSGAASSAKKDSNMIVFKCPYFPSVHRIGISQEFVRLKRELQALKGSDVLRDVRCVLSHPTSSNCFIESHGFNSIPEDLRRQTALQQVTDLESLVWAARASES